MGRVMYKAYMRHMWEFVRITVATCGDGATKLDVHGPDRQDAPILTVK